MCFLKSFSWLSFIFITKEFQGSLYFFLILFNFQDAVSVALASSFNIISHSKLFVKYFFQVFQKFFLCHSLLRDSFNIISLSFLFVKYFFKFFSKSFFVISSALLRQLNYYITFSFLCQALFKKFFSSSLSSSRNGLRLLFLFFFSFQSKSNILLTLSHGLPRSTVMLLYTFFLTLSSKDVFLY